MRKLLQNFLTPKYQAAHQFITLLIYTLLSILLSYSLEFYPRLRCSYVTLGYGVLGALACVIATAIALIAMLKFWPSHTKQSLKSMQAWYHHSKFITKELLVGHAVVSACAEEILLRGFVLTWILSTSLTGAMIVNSFLSFLTYILRTSLLSGRLFSLPVTMFSLTKIIEGSILAVIFIHTKSLAAIALARLISEIIVLFTLQYINVNMELGTENTKCHKQLHKLRNSIASLMRIKTKFKTTSLHS